MRSRIFIAGLFVLPAAHPLLLPWVGPPSHLLWWIHVLPVAVVAFRGGLSGAVSIVAASGLAVLVGERAFGAGYGVPADWQTVAALVVAILGTHVLVASFALHARATARRYQTLFYNAAGAILRTDERGRIRAANPAALRLFGCRWRDLRNRTLREVSWLSELPAPEDMAESGWSGTIQAKGPNTTTTKHVTVVAVGGDDQSGHQIIFLDRTEQVAHDRDFERQARLAVLGSTLAGVAHEMKSPLQVILAYAELGLDPDASPAETRDALEMIDQQADNLRGLVRDLLGFSRPEAEPTRVRLSEVVERVVALQRVSHGNAVSLEEHLEWDGTVVASGARLEQIISNLIANAVDAAPMGRGLVEIELKCEGDSAVVIVSDNGDGIDPTIQDRIFEPFVSSKASGEGTGLGLAISRRLAGAMGGTLTARNRPRGGASFELRIPVEPSRNAPVTLLETTVSS